jgi:DNA replication protein DnaC
MELTTLLERLRMDHLEAQLDGICEQAAKGDLDYKGFLAQDLEAEWRGRYQRGVESRLKLARFPWIKTLEQFDFDFQPSIDRKVIRELAGLSFVERAENVVLLGPPGVGKTHLAVALGVKAVEAGYSVLFLTLESLMGRLLRARQQNRLERTLQQLVYPRVLILDELGYLPLTREEASLFFRLLVRRYERASLVVYEQQELRGLGGDLERPGRGHRNPGPAAPPRHDHQHQRGQLPAAGEEGRPARAPAQAGRPRGGGSLRMTRHGTRTGVNSGHPSFAFSRQDTFHLTASPAFSVRCASGRRVGRRPDPHGRPAG